MAKQDEFTRYTIRIPQPLYKAIEEAASSAGRSVNAEVTQRLEFAMSEDIWERKQFIDTLNFKQHILDKQMHMLSQYVIREHGLKQEAQYERALRNAAEEILASLSAAILAEDESPSELSRIAATILKRRGELSAEDLDQALNEMYRRIGDRSNVESEWEDHLSEEEKQWLSESRRWVRPYD